MSRTMYRLWERLPGGDWTPRKVFASEKSRDWLKQKYDRQEPDREHETRPEEMEDCGKPAFVRYVR